MGWSRNKTVLINNNDQQKCNDHDQPLSDTEALTCLHLVTARGLDQVHQHYPCSQSSSFLEATASPCTYLPTWLGQWVNYCFQTELCKLNLSCLWSSWSRSYSSKTKMMMIRKKRALCCLQMVWPNLSMRLKTSQELQMLSSVTLDC